MLLNEILNPDHAVKILISQNEFVADGNRTNLITQKPKQKDDQSHFRCYEGHDILSLDSFLENFYPNLLR